MPHYIEMPPVLASGITGPVESRFPRVSCAQLNAASGAAQT